MDNLLGRLNGLGYAPEADFRLQDDGEGAYIADWLSADPQPGTDELTAAPIKSPVPLTISPLQARRALRQVGIKAQVDAYVVSLPEGEQDAWEYALQIERTHPIIVNGGAALGMSEEEINDLFRLGATL